MSFTDRPGIPRAIVGFHTDEAGHWVADLACGHGQHVRHEPPLASRPWVLTAAGRTTMLDTELSCVRCVRLDLPDLPDLPDLHETMYFALDEGVAVLRRTPHVLRALLEGLPPVWLTANEGGETWSPYVIVGHLIHGERTDWIARAQIILAQTAGARFEPFDRLAQFRESKGQPIGDLLHEFAELRQANLVLLESWSLTDETLALTGVHPAFGAVSLRQLLSTWVAHDLSHLTQITRALAKQYRDAVGPWREYLSVMDR